MSILTDKINITTLYFYCL